MCSKLSSVWLCRTFNHQQADQGDALLVVCCFVTWQLLPRCFGVFSTLLNLLLRNYAFKSLRRLHFWSNICCCLIWKTVWHLVRFFLTGHRIPCITYSPIQFLHPVTFKCLHESYTTTPHLSARCALPVITLLCDHLGSPFRDAPLGEAVQDPPAPSAPLTSTRRCRQLSEIKIWSLGVAGVRAPPCRAQLSNRKRQKVRREAVARKSWSFSKPQSKSRGGGYFPALFPHQAPLDLLKEALIWLLDFFFHLKETHASKS